MKGLFQCPPMEWKGNHKYLHEKKFFSILLQHLPHVY